MKKRLLFCCIIYLFPFFLMSVENLYPIIQPWITTYTKEKEEILLKRNYIKVSEDQFDGNKLFREIYKTIHGEDYTDFMPDYCINNFLFEGIYLSMLNTFEYSGIITSTSLSNFFKVKYMASADPTASPSGLS